MPPVMVHPIKDENDTDSVAINCTFRLRVLDAATGLPLSSAYAEKPVVDRKFFDRRDTHPFRVLNEREVKFCDQNTTTYDFLFNTKTLRTYVPNAGASTATNKALDVGWRCVGEFFYAKPGGEILASADGKDVFVEVDLNDKCYAFIKSGGTVHAQRDLITDPKGILAVPLPFTDWFSGTKVTVKFRDYKILKAEGKFDPESLLKQEKADKRPASENGHKLLKVTLADAPDGNAWSAEVGTTKGSFEDEIVFDPGAVSFKEIDFTVWAVRKVKPLSEVVPAALIANGSGANSRIGILIHYNSGYYMFEQRPDKPNKVLCRNAFTNNENDFMMRPAMAMNIMAKINAGFAGGGRLGYHYHVDRDGTILPAVAEALSIWHAGNTRERKAVPAIENVDANPRNASHTIPAPKESLNNKYIGIDVLSHHAGGYHFTERQHWYLDRLIENIKSRNAGIEWYRIQGHDEARDAYRTQHGITAANEGDANKVKSDPGAALEKGGMEALRGRHGATFAAPAVAPVPVPAGAAP